MFNRQKNSQDDNATGTPEGSWRAEIQRLGQDPGPASPTQPPEPTRMEAPQPSATPAEPPVLPVQTSGAETAPVGSGTGSMASTAEQLTSMLSRLDTLGQYDDGPATQEKSVGDDEVITHGGTLRAAVEARENAQRILELATRERAEATAQSEQILLEATAMSNRLQKEAKADSDRIRRETQAWAADQRKAVTELVKDVRATATSEAEQLRKETMASVKEEVESFGLQARARECEAAEREAEAIRAHARATLEQSRSMLTDIQTAIGSLTESVDSFVTQMRTRAAEVEAVLSDPSLFAKPSSDETADTTPQEGTGEDAAESPSTAPRNKESAGTKGVPHLPTPREPVSENTAEMPAEPDADASDEQDQTGPKDEK